MSGNFSQRIFDVLKASPDLLTTEQIAQRTRLSAEAIKGALKRLTRMRCLTTVCQDRVWRYGLRPSAQRPRDKRGIREKEIA